MSNDAKYLTDLKKHLDTVEYGDITVSFKRVNHKTVEMIPSTIETVRHEDTEDYLKDLILFIRALEKSEHTGKVTLELGWKKGTISTLGYHTETKKEYRG